MQYHVFISDARKDNEPRRPDGKGWVHLFRDRLQAQYGALNGRDLEIFFDEDRIESGAQWETRIQGALRQSRIFVAILSPHYLASPICQVELEDSIRFEQSLTPGGDGVHPVYFATAADLEDADSPPDGDDRARLIRDLNSRNRARARGSLEDLAKSNPNDLRASWDVVVSLAKLGEVSKRFGDRRSEAAFLCRALAKLEKLEAARRNLSAQMRAGLEGLRKKLKPGAGGSDG